MRQVYNTLLVLVLGILGLPWLLQGLGLVVYLFIDYFNWVDRLIIQYRQRKMSEPK